MLSSHGSRKSIFQFALSLTQVHKTTVERHSNRLEIKAINFYPYLLLSKTRPVYMGLQCCYGNLRGSEIFLQYKIKTLSLSNLHFYQNMSAVECFPSGRKRLPHTWAGDAGCNPFGSQHSISHLTQLAHSK